MCVVAMAGRCVRRVEGRQGPKLLKAVAYLKAIGRGQEQRVKARIARVMPQEYH